MIEDLYLSTLQYDSSRPFCLFFVLFVCLFVCVVWCGVVWCGVVVVVVVVVVVCVCVCVCVCVLVNLANTYYSHCPLRRFRSTGTQSSGGWGCSSGLLYSSERLSSAPLPLSGWQTVLRSS